MDVRGRRVWRKIARGTADISSYPRTRRAATPADAIPFAGIGRLRTAVRRTTLLRGSLAVAAVALLVAAALTARHLRLPEQSLIPKGRSGVIVLDMSRSVNGSRLEEMRRALTRFAQPGQRIGLVMFSDTRYTLLPPGTPGTQLPPLLLFLRPFRQAPHSKKFSLPASPWDEVFRGGTRVCAGVYPAPPGVPQ